MAILIDTSAFYALADESDTFHERARDFYSDYCEKGDFITTDYILVETWALINFRLSRNSAMTFWKNIRVGIVPIMGVQKMDLDKAWSIGQEYKDQDFSLVDCTTFALMERMGISKCFSFDNHFRIYRYGADKKGVFEILPH